MNHEHERDRLPSIPSAWPAGPVPQPTQELEPSSPGPAPPPRRGPVLVPLLSAFLGALVALAAVYGAGGLRVAPTTTTTEPAPTASTTAAVVEDTEAPPAEEGSSGMTLQLREPSVDAVAVGEIVIPSIVTVDVGRQAEGGFLRAGSGSGVVLDGEGHIVTNDHVVAGASEYRVVFADGRTYPATLVGSDPVTDLAVIQIDAEGLQPISLGSSDRMSVGDPAVAVGNPLGLDGGPSLTVGVLSAFDRQVQTGASEILYGMLQTDAPITQGSSGGALVDEQGRLIGITTAVGVSEIGVEGIGFATPVEIVERVTGELIAAGSADHAYLGITGSTRFEAAADGAQVPAGVEVQGIEPDGAAAGAGLLPGDLITAVDGEAVETMQDLIVRLRRALVGDTVRLTIDRDGTSETVDVVLGVRP